MNYRKQMTKQIYLRLDKRLAERLKRYCDNKKISVDKLIKKLISFYLDKKEAVVKQEGDTE